MGSWGDRKQIESERCRYRCSVVDGDLRLANSYTALDSDAKFEELVERLPIRGRVRLDRVDCG